MIVFLLLLYEVLAVIQPYSGITMSANYDIEAAEYWSFGWAVFGGKSHDFYVAMFVPCGMNTVTRCR
jgi:hypothetical protein